MGPVLRRLYDQMPEPKWVLGWVIALPAAAFSTITHLSRGGRSVPVDVYVAAVPTPRGPIMVW